MKKLSLFSGIGGIDLAAHWAGMETVAFCEREPFPQRVLRKHWPDIPIIDDVHDVTREELDRRGIGAIDIISAGYPCQPFSHAGKRGGETDDRHLWPEVIRIIREVRPRWFVGENVAGHITLGLDDVLADLADADYRAQAFVIPAAAVQASHRRDRVFIVGYSERSGCRGYEWGRADKESSNRCADVADAKSQGIGRLSIQPGAARQADTDFIRGCENVAYANHERQQECNSATSCSNVGHTAGRTHERGLYSATRTTKPRMGRNAHEFSDWLDGGINPLDTLQQLIAEYPQPALMGQPQHAWEPPRVASKVPDRVGRIKALGNAVDPLQIYPIIQAIKWIDDMMR